MTLEQIAEALAGRIHDDIVLAPWPNGPGGKFRQLKISLDPGARLGFLAWPADLDQGTIPQAREYVTLRLQEAKLI
jgi:hypothetical protein